jgi:hypothetical protein
MAMAFYELESNSKAIHSGRFHICVSKMSHNQERNEILVQTNSHSEEFH